MHPVDDKTTQRWTPSDFKTQQFDCTYHYYIGGGGVKIVVLNVLHV